MLSQGNFGSPLPTGEGEEIPIVRAQFPKSGG